MPDRTVHDDMGVTYTASQAAERLGIGHAMLRRYAGSYERLTGTELEIHRRDGRLFTQRQLDILQATRDRVQRSGIPVDAALESVLREAELPIELRERSLLPGDSQALVEALTEAYRRANGPLLEELRVIAESNTKLAQDVEALRLELAAQRNTDTEKDESSEPKPGIMAGFLRRYRRVCSALTDDSGDTETPKT